MRDAVPLALTSLFLLLLPACSVEQGATYDAASDTGGADSAPGECPLGRVDLDGLPGCECEVVAETCNARDDDCDRVVDEDISISCGTPGTCSEGTHSCVGGELTDCVRAVAPPPEACDNMVDDDCDMAVDEECACAPVGETRPCGTGRGECRRGDQTCAADGWGRCEGNVGPATEVCNGLDDDCDDVVDGMTQPCSGDVGICTSGIETCTMGMFGGCTGVEARTETCDAARLDEDCNGVDNDGCACDEGDTEACGCLGTRTCDLTGSYGGCVEPSMIESCNGEDDDCDGTTDEGTTCGMCSQVNDGTRSYLICFQIMRDYAGARAYCMMFGYDLATIEDATENDWLNQQERDLHENNQLWWYGGSDAAMEGTWRWEPTMMDASYTDWAGGGEPDNGTSENCLSNENRSNPEWNSDDCTSDRLFVCEDQDS